MTVENKPQESVVDLDIPVSTDVPQRDGSEKVLDDLFGPDETAPDTTTKAGDDTPKPAETVPPAKTEDGKPATATPAKDDTTPAEPYAKIGSRTFTSKEELERFTSSQLGYNGMVTGALKKVRPDLFNDDGSLDHTKLSQIEKATEKMETAAETVKELQDVDPTTMTDEQKDDLKKAQAILGPVLRSMGVAFKSDQDYVDAQEIVQTTKAESANEAKSVVDTFVKDHPLLDDHRVELGQFMEKNELTDLGVAWDTFKTLKGIKEEAQAPAAPTPRGDGKNHSVDKNIPVIVSKTSGTPPPPSGSADFFDEIIGAKGMK